MAKIQEQPNPEQIAAEERKRKDQERKHLIQNDFELGRSTQHLKLPHGLPKIK